MLQTKNYNIKRGDTFELPVYFTTEEAPLDITGYKIYFMAKEKISDDDDDAVISKTITTHTDSTNGESTIQLTSTDTDRVGNYFYAIKVILTTKNRAMTICEGMLNISDSVVDATS